MWMFLRGRYQYAEWLYADISDVTEYGKRTSELFYEPLPMKQDTTSIDMVQNQAQIRAA